MSVEEKKSCVIFPTQQIVSTSIAAMCTALLMVEQYTEKKQNSNERLYIFTVLDAV